jgi:hypothetical protein
MRRTRREDRVGARIQDLEGVRYVSVLSPAQLPTGVWVLDAVHSSTGFSVKYMMVSNFRSHFEDVSATLAVEEDGSARLAGAVASDSIAGFWPQSEPSWSAILPSASCVSSSSSSCASPTTVGARSCSGTQSNPRPVLIAGTATKAAIDATHSRLHGLFWLTADLAERASAADRRR